MLSRVCLIPFLVLICVNPLSAQQREPQPPARVAVAQVFIMPDVINLPLAEARARLTELERRLGLQISTQMVRVNTDRAGIVIRQSPAAKAQLVRGTFVILYVSELNQPQTLAMPYLIGQEINVARNNAVVVRAQLRVETEARFDPNARPNTVIVQSPPPRAALTIGQTIRLVIADVGTTVPDVTGIPLEQARPLLRRARLSVGAVKLKPDNAAPGTVIAQSPAVGTRVANNRPIELTVATEMKISVPEVRRHTEQAARRLIEGVGLRVVRQEIVNNTKTPGLVDEQKPAPGTSVSKQSEVTIFVNKLEEVVVPDVVGKSLAAATQTIQAKKFKVATRTQVDNTRSENTVINQNPSAGRAATFGSTVTLTLAIAQKVAVPDVVGRRVKEARQILTDNDLRMQGDAPDDALVERQSPSARAMIPLNQAVTIVARLPAPPTPLTPAPITPIPTRTLPSVPENRSDDGGSQGARFWQMLGGLLALLGAGLAGRVAYKQIRNKTIEPRKLNWSVAPDLGRQRVKAGKRLRGNLDLSLTPQSDAGRQHVVTPGALIDKERIRYE